jgi:light-regulated signal transduction histidine kinase (bacteriophytochrome)
MDPEAEKWKSRFESERRARLEAEALLLDRLRHLFQVKAQLESANHELDAFVHSVSHDLRAPLRAMSGYGRLALESCNDALSEPAKRYLERINESCLRLSDIIDGLLELSRVTREQIRREQVDLTALAEGIVQELRDRDPGRLVETRVMSSLSARGDPRLLGVVLRNLLENAWKFSRKRPQAHIEVGAKELNGQTVYFVRDDGAGFDMKYSAKLFGTFQRLHAESEFEGAGIGLATAQRVVQRHGGRIWAEAAVEQGATFYFTL